MQLRSDSFEPWTWLDTRLAFGEHDPDTHFRFAGNRNPHLAWSDAPDGTKAFALLCFDLDVPTVADDVNQEGRSVPLDLPRFKFYHWVLANLPADLREIGEGTHSDGVTPRGKPVGPTPDGGLQGVTHYTNWFEGDPDMGGTYAGYDGPAPPWNDTRIHGYHFVVFALDSELALPEAFTGADVEQAMQGHVLAQAQIVGLYAINPDVAP